MILASDAGMCVGMCIMCHTAKRYALQSNSSLILLATYSHTSHKAHSVSIYLCLYALILFNFRTENSQYGPFME